MDIIEVENLSFAYSKQDKAIKDISFKIERGSWVSIIGHNGSGKSTLSKLIDGLLAPDKGSIYIDGEKLCEETVNRLRKKIGIVFQNPDNQFVGTTVRYDIAFGLENMNTPREEMIKLVDEFSKKVLMYDYLDQEPHNLSGGQKQRVAIAGLLAMNCDIMIFDEATSMLDPEGVRDVVDLLKDLKQNYDKTMITITHDLNMALLSDRVIVLNDGKIILDGTPEDVFSHTKELMETELDIPFNLKLYNEAINDEKISKNRKLVDALWQLSLKK